jgi:hypothetical protein
MIATLRDTSGMMVLLEIGVECSAKIAMTPLLNRFAAMSLLLDRDVRRSHFSRHARVLIF